MRAEGPKGVRKLQATALKEEVVDPVCGMTVDRARARHLAEHDGVVYAFCRMGCRTAFIQEPGAYVPGPFAPSSAGA